MELGKRWGKARSTCNTRNPRIKSNKTSSHQQITKNNWGNFRFRTKNNQIKLENKERGLRNRDQRGSGYQDDVGWNPRWPIFHERSGSLRGTRRTRGGKRGGNTRETLTQQEIDHTCARSSKHKERYKIQSQQRTIHGNRFFSVRRS